MCVAWECEVLNLIRLLIHNCWSALMFLLIILHKVVLWPGFLLNMEWKASVNTLLIVNFNYTWDLWCLFVWKWVLDTITMWGDNVTFFSRWMTWWLFKQTNIWIGETSIFVPSLQWSVFIKCSPRKEQC